MGDAPAGDARHDAIAFERTKAECAGHGEDCRGDICSVIRYAEAQREARRRAEAALGEIVKLGRVCPLFEICGHDACADSSGAFLIAQDALAALRGAGPEADG